MFAIVNLALRFIGLFISTKYVLEWFFDARDYFRRDTTGDLLRGESDIVRIFLKGGTACKTIIQQGCRLYKSDFWVWSSHNDGGKADSISLCSSTETIFCFRCGSGF